jgi:hypothetical protein
MRAYTKTTQKYKANICGYILIVEIVDNHDDSCIFEIKK